MNDDLITTTTRFRPRLRLPLAHLALRTGQELGVSDWISITQPKIDAFAEATGDRQWIHTDPDRAASTPFRGTIAHGYLTLALAPAMLADVLDLSGYAMALNTGIDRLRFIAPVPVDSRLRLHVVLTDLEVAENVGQLRLTLTFEIDGSEKPACVASVQYRLIEDTA